MATRARPEKVYYQVLGLHPEATEEAIRKAYRRLALQWHPDRNPGHPHAEERFKEISEAYAVLIDPAKRRDYDRARRAGAPYRSRHSREDLFRDLFADPGASAIFEELAREFERSGVRVDRHHFRRTLFGGRAVVTGGVFVVTPLTPVLALFRLARAAWRGAAALPSPAPAATPLARPRKILQGDRSAGGLGPNPAREAPGAAGKTGRGQESAETGDCVGGAMRSASRRSLSKKAPATTGSMEAAAAKQALGKRAQQGEDASRASLQARAVRQLGKTGAKAIQAHVRARTQRQQARRDSR